VLGTIVCAVAAITLLVSATALAAARHRNCRPGPHTNLSGCFYDHRNLTRANFTRSNLTGAQITNSLLKGANRLRARVQRPRRRQLLRLAITFPSSHAALLASWPADYAPPIGRNAAGATRGHGAPAASTAQKARFTARERRALERSLVHGRQNRADRGGIISLTPS
jgi:hypothetical protein